MCIHLTCYLLECLSTVRAFMPDTVQTETYTGSSQFPRTHRKRSPAPEYRRKRSRVCRLLILRHLFCYYLVRNHAWVDWALTRLRIKEWGQKIRKCNVALLTAVTSYQPSRFWAILGMPGSIGREGKNRLTFVVPRTRWGAYWHACTNLLLHFSFPQESLPRTPGCS